MALFNGSVPLSQFADTPDLLPYATTLTKRNGKPTGIKKALDWLLPAAGAVVGTVIAPGIGTKIGASLGTAATSAFNRSERKRAEELGATDALQNIDNSLGSTVSSGNLVNIASGLLNFTSGSSTTTSSSLQSVDPTADPSGLGQGVMQATGMTDYNNTINNFKNNLSAAQMATPGRSWNVSFNSSGVNPADVLGTALSIPALNQSPALPRQSRYAPGFADGGTPQPPGRNPLAGIMRLGRTSTARPTETTPLRTETSSPAPVTPEASSGAVAAGAQFTQGWARQRARQGFMGLNSRDAQGISTPVVQPTEQLLAQRELDGNRPLKPGQHLNGFYSFRTDQSYVNADNTPRQQSSDATHETTHDWQNTIDRNHRYGNSPIRQSYATISAEIDRSAKPADAYYGKPIEVHARIMEGRAALGLTPNDVVDQQTIDRLKTEYPQKYKELRRVLDDDGIINSFNKTVYNENPMQDTGELRAADGGMVIDPLPIRQMDAGRTRRRQQRLSDGLSERVDVELENNARAQADLARQAQINTYNQSRVNPSEITRTQDNRANAIEANQQGADYTRNWLTGRGYGDQTGNVMTPILLRPADYANNSGYTTYESNGVYRPDQDRSYAIDFYDRNQTRSTATHESTHDAQDALKDDAYMQQSLSTLASRVEDGSDAYLADPKEIQARLMEMRQGINQDPSKPFNRFKWRLGNIANFLTFGLANKAQNTAFREAKQVLGRDNVFQSLNDTFANGGSLNAGGYKRYPESDKSSEDIIMLDKSTGTKVGEMRYRERIYDQKATDTIDKMVDALRKNPNSKGFEWLGKFVFDETGTHADHVMRFADGGKTAKPHRSDSNKVVLIPNEYLNL